MRVSLVATMMLLSSVALLLMTTTALADDAAAGAPSAVDDAASRATLATPPAPDADEPPFSDAERASIDKFWTWLSSHGDEVDIARVRIGRSTRDATTSVGGDEWGRCVRVREAVRAGDTVLRVPASLVWTTAAARRSLDDAGINATLLSPNERGTSATGMHAAHRLFAAKALLEGVRGTSSPWLPWLAVWPRTFSTLPYWSDDERAVVISRTNDRVPVDWERPRVAESQLLRALTDAAGVDNAAMPAARISATNVRWLLSAVSTRTLYATASRFVLAPLVDMINHATGRGALVLADDGSIGVRTLVDLRAGDELTIDYGHLNSLMFLDHYGFVPASNRHDFFQFSIGRPQGTAFTDGAVAALLEQHAAALGVNAYQLKFGTDEQAWPEYARMLARQRVHTLRPEELGRVTEAALLRTGVSIANDLTALRAMYLATAQLAAGFPSSIDADRALAAQPTTTTNVRNGLRLLVNQKLLVQLSQVRWEKVWLSKLHARPQSVAVGDYDAF